MPVVVSLSEIIDAMETQSEESRAYLDPATGKIVEISDEDQMLVEEDVDPSELPEWQREALPGIRAALEALESNRLLALPDKFEIHEWDIMRRFANERDDENERQELLNAIHGSGAFRMFKSCLRRLGIEQQWHSFRDARLEQHAKVWLEAHGVAYRRMAEICGRRVGGVRRPSPSRGNARPLRGWNCLWR